MSCCKRVLFLLTNAGYPRLKRSWTRSSSWERRSASTARPFGINFQWIIPSKFHQTHNITLEPNRFFSDNFDRLTGTESLFLGVRVAVMDPFFITCDNSPDKSNIRGITDKLTTDIHSTLSMLKCQFMRYRSTASVWFSKCLNPAMYGNFDAPSSPNSLWVLFCGFSSKTLRVFSIFHNLDLPERGKSLVFSSPAFKRWNQSCPTRLLTTPSPSTSYS